MNEGGEAVGLEVQCARSKDLEQWYHVTSSVPLKPRDETEAEMSPAKRSLCSGVRTVCLRGDQCYR